MSSVQFVSNPEKELETLRETWKTLNDILKNIANAEVCLQNHDLKLTADHLKVAKWNVGQVKKMIKVLGEAKKRHLI